MNKLKICAGIIIVIALCLSSYKIGYDNRPDIFNVEREGIYLNMSCPDERVILRENGTDLNWYCKAGKTFIQIPRMEIGNHTIQILYPICEEKIK